MKKIFSAFLAGLMLTFVLLPTAKVSATGSFQFVTTPPLPSAIVGNSYSATVTFSYSGSYAPNATISGLPGGIIGNGLSSNPDSVIGLIPGPTGTASVILSGTPTQDGQYTVSISLDDQHGATASQTFALMVAKQGTFNVTTTSLPDATIGQPYSASINLTYNGSYAPNAYFVGLPPGITAGGSYPNVNNVIGLIPASDGSISLQLKGTPTQSGSYVVSMTLDGTTAQTTKTFALLIAQNGSLNITTNTLPSAVVGSPYNATVSATYSGTYAPNATWTGLPSGITGQGFASSPNNVIGIIPGSGGAINLTLTGTPTQAGTFAVTLQMTDQHALNVSKTFALAVSSSANSTANQNFQITTTSLPPGNVGKTYASGIYYTYTGQDALTATFTSLPPGLYTGTCGSSCLTNTGMTPASNGGTGTVYISGTPTQAGNYSVSLYINDPTFIGSASSGISKQFTIQINPAGVANNMTPTSPLFSGPSTVQAGTSASYTFSSWDQDNDGYNGGSLSYSVNWGDNSPVTTQSGFASGSGFTTSHTWTNAGNYQIAVTVTPGLGNTVQGSYPVQVTSTAVTPTPTPTPTPTTGSGINLPDGTVIKLPNGPTVYLVSGGQLTPFTSAQDFLSKGYSWSQVQQVSPSQVTPPSTSSSNSSGLTTSSFYPYPSGSLVNDGGTVYFIGSGHSKVPFTSSQAFVGLGYSFGNVIQGDLTNYALSSYALSSSNIAHPWGSWLISKGTIYYFSQDGLIGVPNSQIFTANGGNWNLLVKADSYDMAAPVLSPMTSSDTRVTQ